MRDTFLHGFILAFNPIVVVEILCVPTKLLVISSHQSWGGLFLAATLIIHVYVSQLWQSKSVSRKLSRPKFFSGKLKPKDKTSR